MAFRKSRLKLKHQDLAINVDVRTAKLEPEHVVERPFSLHEPTVGSDRTLSAETWIPVATIDEYLVSSIHELWGETPTDIAQLYELDEHIRDFGVAPVVPFNLTAAMYRNWGILTPFFAEEDFSMIVRITDQKIEPEHEMPVLTPEEAAEAEAAEAGEAPTLEQDSPFS